MTEDNGHIWHERVFASMQIRCCMNCGFIKNEDQPNKACPGPIGVELRNTAPSTPGYSSASTSGERDNG